MYVVLELRLSLFQVNFGFDGGTQIYLLQVMAKAISISRIAGMSSTSYNRRGFVVYLLGFLELQATGNE
jgi:hypothetical protein